MSTKLHSQHYSEPFDRGSGDGGIWYQLRAEREQVCEALLGLAPFSKPADDRSTNNLVDAAQLQARLRLIDDALDRLVAGCYGDCVVCGRWIEDTKLHEDPALPFCCACQRHTATPAPLLSCFPHQPGGISPTIRGLIRS